VNWRRILEALGLSVLVGGCASQMGPQPQAGSPTLVISAEALNTGGETWVAHKDYLAMVVPFEPIRGLFEKIKAQTGFEGLRNRGEAHVTVITPPEFAELNKNMTIDDINRIALEERIQQAHLDFVCVGSGRALIEGHEERTYFLVVRSSDLLRIREKIAEQFVKNGGQRDKFAPRHFYPHITIGYTKTDLHEAQGVIKDQRSCEFPLNIR
jgi:2'-5' RNA ligase